MVIVNNKFKIIIIFIYFIMLSNDFAYANAMPQQSMAFNLPPTIGKIVDSFEGTKKDKIILIQDLHCNPKVQENIYKILDRAKKRYGEDFQTIGIEGTPVQKIDTSVLSDMPHNIKKIIVDYLVSKGYLSGAEWFEIMNDKAVELKGIEDDELYVKNFVSLYNSLWYRYELEEVFDEVKIGYNQAKKYFWTEEVGNLLEKKELFDKGGIGLQEYISYLKDASKTYLIHFEISYPQLNAYLGLAEIKNRIKPNLIAMEAE